MTAPAIRLSGVTLRYRTGRGRPPVLALDGIDLVAPTGQMLGLIGPDGVGKSTLLSLVAGARVIQQGRVEVLGGDMIDAGHRARTGPRIAYMPQGLGRNLYPTLSVFENVDFFGRLFGQGRAEREHRIHELLAGTGLAPFAARAAGKLSGGMKQKLGLCCALIHDPDLLILDEPTTGVDPLSRGQFWELIDGIRRERPGMTVLVATAYMEEAARFDSLVAMHGGRILAAGSPTEILRRTGTDDLDAAFIALLPAAAREGHRRVVIPPRLPDVADDVAIEAEHLTIRFGDFTAVDDVSFRIPRGEIFGFLGSNGCGKTTTMKMLTGLLPATAGRARLFGREFDPRDLSVRRRVGYMSQSFSLYSELTVRQNLDLHARLFAIESPERPRRIAAVAQRFGLGAVMDALPDNLPLGIRQRLSLAVALIHAPDILILDEPTSGVDPVARDAFWQILADLSRRDRVTIFVSTHFMNEAVLCDRISLMHAGRVLVSDTPEAILRRRGAETLDAAFVDLLREASAADPPPPPPASAPAERTARPSLQSRWPPLRRMLAYALREALELRRDRIRATLAIIGSVLLMFVLGYGINMDVERLTFAVLDHDDTTVSRDYADQIRGSRYFTERPPIRDHAELDRRMHAGDVGVAIEFPSGFARQSARGHPVEIGVWLDGALPSRAETARAYIQGMHATWLAQKARELRGGGAEAGTYRIAMRYRYNPDVQSLVAMVPAVIPLLLLMIPAVLAALSVVREKELGSIVNFYVTPVSRLEFLVGKQVPYVVLGMLNFLMLTASAIFVLGVPFTGSFATLAVAAVLYLVVATAMGLVVSAFMRSQIAAIFATALLTIIPVVQFSGLVDPVSSLQGAGRIIGEIYPASHFIAIARGTFSKGLGLADLAPQILALAVSIPVLLGLGAVLLRKQAR